MSKLFKSLKGVSDLRDQKYTLAVKNKDAVSPEHNKEDSQAPELPEGSWEKNYFHAQNDTVTLDKNVWYLSMICVAFMGLVALILSVKAFSQIQRGHSNVMRLSQVILKQHNDIAGLKARVNAIKISKTPSGSLPFNAKISRGNPEREIGELLKNIDSINAEVKNLKEEHQRLITKWLDLNNEVNQLKIGKNLQR